MIVFLAIFYFSVVSVLLEHRLHKMFLVQLVFYIGLSDIYNYIPSIYFSLHIFLPRLIYCLDYILRKTFYNKIYFSTLYFLFDYTFSLHNSLSHPIFSGVMLCFYSFIILDDVSYQSKLFVKRLIHSCMILHVLWRSRLSMVTYSSL